MKIAFWSPIHGQATTTSNMITVAFLSGIIHKKKCIITQTQFCNNNLEAPLVGSNLKNRSSEDFFRGMGLDALIRSFKAAPVDFNTAENCCISFANTNVSLLPGTAKVNWNHFYDEANKSLPQLINQIDLLYDITFLDLNSGDNPISMEIIRNADLVVVNLPQNIHIIEDYFTNQREKIKGEAFYLIGNYDCDAKYNLSTIRKKYHKFISKDNSGAVPYNTLYLDAQNESRVVDFIRDNINCKKSDSNYYFMERSKSATAKIIKAADAIKTKKEMVK